MFFKFTRLFILATMAISLVGCDKFLKGRSADENGDSDIVTVSTDEVNCMKDVPAELEKYFKDQANAKSMNQIISCTQHSLRTFMRLTRGKVPDGYLAKEVQFFFNRNLVGKGDFKISDEFLEEIMKVKTVVVGGNHDVMTRLELEQFIQFLGEMEKELVKLNGQVRLASFKGEVSNYKIQDLAHVKSNLESISQFLLKRTKITSSRYQLTDFISFLEQLDLFMGETESLGELLKWMPVAEKVKLVFMGDSAKLVGDRDWEASTKWVVETYVTLLRFYYEIKDREFQTPQEWKTLISWLDEAIEKVEQAPAMREKKILEAQALDALVEEVFKLKLFKTVLTSELIKSTYKRALVHFIEVSTSRGDPLLISGLTDGHLRVLKQEYNVWKQTQVAINEIYLQNPKQNIRSLRSAFQKFNPSNRVSVGSLEKEELSRSWADFLKLLNTQPAIGFDEKTKTHISYRMEENELPFVGMNMMNSIRTYVRLALRGYGNQQSRFNFDNLLSKEKLIALQADFQEFAEKIKFVDSRSKNSASNTFDQGALLAFHSNGDDWLDATEIYETLSFLISGGRIQLNEIYDDLKVRQCLRPGKDIFDMNFVDESCFYKALRSRYMVYFDHVPGAVYFMKSLSDEQWAQFYQGLLAVAISPEHVQGQLESPEIRTMTTLVNFLEALVRVYDKDQNTVLSEDEVVAAVPRFEKFISKVSPIGDFMIEDILLYLAYEGKKPSDGIEGIGQLTWFVGKRHTIGLGEVSKLNIIKLLAILKKDSEAHVPTN